MKYRFGRLLAVLGLMVVMTVSFAAEPAAALGGGNCGKKPFLGFRAWYEGLCKGDDIAAPKKGDEDDLAAFVWTIVLNVLTDISIGVGYLAVGFIIYGGYLYIMAQGDPAKMARGKKTLTSAVIGTVIAASAVVIVNTAKAALLINAGDGWKQTADTHKLIQNAFNWAYGMAGVVAVAFIVKGGIEYIVSQGDPGKVSKATRSIIYALAGLIIVLLAFAITTFVLNTIGSAV